MARKSFLFLACIASGVASISFGAEAAGGASAWQLIETKGKTQTELDIASISRKDNSATGWVQTTYSSLTSTQSGAYFAYRSMKEHLRVQCRERTATVLARAYFNDEGAEIAMIKGNGETRSIAPDTAEHRVMTRMCNQATQTASVEPAKIDAAKRAAGAPVAPGPAPAAIPVSNRYMDGPTPQASSMQAKAGFLKASAEAHAPAPAAAEKAGEKAADKAVEKASPITVAPAPKAPADDHGHAAKAPASKAAAHAPAHAAAAAHAPARARAPESRQQTVARVLDERAHGPKSGTKAAAGHVDEEHVHWSYDGEFAPYRWGDMKSDFATCKTGTRQSPIDIRNPVVSEIEPIQFHYEDVPLKVTNNGHTIQVDVAPGSFILHGGARYELVQFHFHTPSEERINGRVFDMVAHLVHKSAQGKLAVVAVLLTAGKEQPMLQQVWNAMPGTPNRTRERLDVSINAKQLLPADPAFYSFMGSLTTPPCTEGVQWLVMKTPVEISREQVGHFAALYPMNARPLQAQNDRLIKAGR